MLDDYRKVIHQANALVEGFQTERSRILKEGRTKQWEVDQIAALQKVYEAKANETTTEMLKLSLNGLVEAKRKADRLRKKPPNLMDKADGAEKLYHQQRAMNLLGEIKDDAAIEEYDYIASSLDDVESKYRYIYEDVLRSRVKDKAYDVGLKLVLHKHKSDEEKAALRELDMASVMLDHDKMLRGIISQDIENIAKSGEKTRMDYGDLLNDVLSNAKKQAGIE